MRRCFARSAEVLKITTYSFSASSQGCPSGNELAPSPERWQYFEELGFDSVWDCDHFNQTSNESGPYFEGWTMLAALAARTTRIRIGVLVSCNTFRHPGLLAQEAVTVDHISNGRLELGLGCGYTEGEHSRFGIELPPPGDRRRMFHEAVQIIDSLFRNDTTTFNGRYYQLDGAYVRPAPVQKPGPPFTIGAHKTRMHYALLGMDEYYMVTLAADEQRFFTYDGEGTRTNKIRGRAEYAPFEATIRFVPFSADTEPDCQNPKKERNVRGGPLCRAPRPGATHRPRSIG